MFGINNDNIFGVILNKVRKLKKLSIRQLADNSNLSHTYISQLENGKRNPPKREVIKNISQGLSKIPEENQQYYNRLLAAAGYSTEGLNFDELLYREMQYETLNLIDETNYKIVSSGYSIHEIIQEGYLWVSCPDGSSFEVSMDEVTRLNNEIDSFIRFKLDELTNKHMNEIRKKE